MPKCTIEIEQQMQYSTKLVKFQFITALNLRFHTTAHKSADKALLFHAEFIYNRCHSRLHSHTGAFHSENRERGRVTASWAISKHYWEEGEHSDLGVGDTIARNEVSLI